MLVRLLLFCARVVVVVVWCLCPTVFLYPLLIREFKKNLEKKRLLSCRRKKKSQTTRARRLWKSKRIMGKKQLSGAMKRKKKKEKEDAAAEAAADLERLKLGPSKLWTGLVLHHRDIFVSHVLPKLNQTDRGFFSYTNGESRDVLEYAGINAIEQDFVIFQCLSISTLEWLWDNAIPWGTKTDKGTVINHAWFCYEVALTNKLELLKWAREVKHCEWDENTIDRAARTGNLEMLKYCFANDCPYDEKTACVIAAEQGHLDCLRFLFNKIKPSRETEKDAAETAAQYGRIDILKYLVEERKISDDAKTACVFYSVFKGHLDCLKYMVEEAKNDSQNIALARHFKRTECLHYLREKGCPEPTDEEYAQFAETIEGISSLQR